MLFHLMDYYIDLTTNKLLNIFRNINLFENKMINLKQLKDSVSRKVKIFHEEEKPDFYNKKTYPISAQTSSVQNSSIAIGTSIHLNAEVMGKEELTIKDHVANDPHFKWNKDVILQYSKIMLAVIGALFLIVLLALSPNIISIWSKVSQFDDAALSTYTKIAKTLIDTGNPAFATSWRVPVKAELKIKDIEEVMDFVAAEFNLKRVGESVLFDDKNKKMIESLTGVPYRFSKTYMFCNSVTAAQMFNHNPAYSAYTPCRISIIEDEFGKRWLYSLNIDIMIYGGHPLPEELKKTTLKVRDGLQAIMQRAAIGDELSFFNSRNF